MVRKKDTLQLQDDYSPDNITSQIKIIIYFFTEIVAR